MLEQSAFAQDINAILDAQFAGRQFQVVSIASGKVLSEAKTFSAASDDMEMLAYSSGGVSNGIDLREVK